MSSLEQPPRITPFLWFATQAEEAANLYVSIFRNARILGTTSSGSASDAASKVMTVSFELDGQRFLALNGGPAFEFTEATSFVIRCDTQEEVDEYWSKLTADGGKEGRCGWLKDRFGLSWQVVPTEMSRLIRSPKALQAMMGMKKLDIAELERAGQS